MEHKENLMSGKYLVFEYLQTNLDIDMTNLLIDIVNDIRKNIPGISDSCISVGLLDWLDFTNEKRGLEC